MNTIIKKGTNDNRTEIESLLKIAQTIRTTSEVNDKKLSEYCGVELIDIHQTLAILRMSRRTFGKYLKKYPEMRCIGKPHSYVKSEVLRVEKILKAKYDHRFVQPQMER